MLVTFRGTGQPQPKWAFHDTGTITWHTFWSKIQKIQQGQNILYVLSSAAVAMAALTHIWPRERWQ